MIYDEKTNTFIDADPTHCTECGAMLADCGICGETASREILITCADCNKLVCRNHISFKCRGCHGRICEKCSNTHKGKCDWTGTYTG